MTWRACHDLAPPVSQRPLLSVYDLKLLASQSSSLSLRSSPISHRLTELDRNSRLSIPMRSRLERKKLCEASGAYILSSTEVIRHGSGRSIKPPPPPSPERYINDQGLRQCGLVSPQSPYGHLHLSSGHAHHQYDQSTIDTC